MKDNKCLTEQMSTKKNNGTSETTPKRVLFFMPSMGHGGGIERYCDPIIQILKDEGTTVETIPLLKPNQVSNLKVKLLFMLRIFKLIYRLRNQQNIDVIIAHPNLVVPVLAVCKLNKLNTNNTVAITHGEDIWTMGPLSKLMVKRYINQSVTVSTFSAGAVSAISTSQIVPSLIKKDWFELLAQTDPASIRGEPDQICLLTVFRLNAASEKGLKEIVEATERVRKFKNCQLVVAGSGELPEDISSKIKSLSWVKAYSNVNDDKLAKLYKESDIFVLATRTRSSAPTSVEGLGIVLVEAQLTGTPVIAPAHGGSDDAFLNGITGLKPFDESSEALADVIAQVATDDELRQRLGNNAGKWSRSIFNPDRQRAQIIRVFAGSNISDEDSSINLEFK